MTHRDFTTDILPQESLLPKASRHTECVPEPNYGRKTTSYLTNHNIPMPEGRGFTARFGKCPEKSFLHTFGDTNSSAWCIENIHSLSQRFLEVSS